MNSYKACDDEWILRKTEGTYFLRIGDFASKVNWSPGTFLDSKIFLIGNTKFKLRFFPNNLCSTKEVVNDNGLETDVIDNHIDRFIGVYLYNESNFDVLADIKLTLGGKTMALQKQFLREKECIGRNIKKLTVLIYHLTYYLPGWSSFLTHHQLLYTNILNREGKLEVRAEVTTNWERKVDQAQSLTSTDLLQGVLQELRGLRKEMMKMEARMNNQVQQETVWPQCTKCWESLRPPNAIFQCLGGHVICEGCHESAGQGKCPSCNISLGGRATALESYLRSLN